MDESMEIDRPPSDPHLLRQDSSLSPTQKAAPGQKPPPPGANSSVSFRRYVLAVAQQFGAVD
jgi:hypothetical protein